jgi:ABC-2 type transport system permease protein
MADSVALLWRQYRFERHLFWRNPSAAFFNFLLPLIFLALFGAIVSGNRHELQIIVPGIAGMSVMSTTFTALAYNLTSCASRGCSSGCAARRCRAASTSAVWRSTR